MAFAIKFIKKREIIMHFFTKGIVFLFVLGIFFTGNTIYAQNAGSKGNPTTYHIVKKGETARKIALRYGIVPRVFYAKNAKILKGNFDLIFPGQKLIITMSKKTEKKVITKLIKTQKPFSNISSEKKTERTHTENRSIGIEFFNEVENEKKEILNVDKKILEKKKKSTMKKVVEDSKKGEDVIAQWTDIYDFRFSGDLKEVVVKLGLVFENEKPEVLIDKFFNFAYKRDYTPENGQIMTLLDENGYKRKIVVALGETISQIKFKNYSLWDEEKQCTRILSYSTYGHWGIIENGCTQEKYFKEKT
jgi:LysM repeat protein